MRLQFTSFKTLLSLLVLIFLIPRPTLSSAAESPFAYSKIDQLSGLSSSKVTAITKDKFGFYWIGTRRGLNYIINGRVEQFSDQQEEIHNREIKFIYTDSDAQLWVATDVDLLLYDYQAHRFNKIPSNNSYSSANAVCSSSQGVVICRRDAIELYDHATGSIRTLEIEGAQNFEFNSLRALDSDNVLLICSQGREIYRLNLITSKIDLYEDIKLPLRTTNYRDRIFIDSRGRLWISIYNQSLVRYSLEAEGALEAEFSVAKSNLSHDLILDIIEYNDEILVATDGGGINSIDIDSDRSRLSTKIFNYRDLPYSKSVYSLFADSDDGLFMGTIRDGLIGIHSIDIQSFRSGNVSDRNDNGNLENTAIMAFCQGQSNVWIATDGDGVWSYTQDNNSFKQIQSTKGLKITDVCNIDSSNLLIAIYGKGVYQLSKRSGELEKIVIVDDQVDKSIADRDMVVSFTQPENSSVMIVADKIYELHNHSTNAVELPLDVTFTAENLFATCQTDQYYYVNNQYYVYQIDKQSGKISTIYNTSQGGLTSARIDKDKVWVIRNHSLYCYNTTTRNEELLLPEISGKALSMEMDARGNLWVTTFNALLAIDLDKNDQVIYFDSSMGFTKDEYLARSTMRMHNGDMLFGGNNGFIAVDGKTELVAQSINPIELLSVRVDQRIVTPESHQQSRVITVPWNYNSIDIEIYAQNRNIYHANRFQYTIDSDGKYSTFESDNRLKLQMPSPGHHTITASYLNNNGQWCSHTEILEIIITPPWWNSIAFRMLIITVLLFSMIAILMLYDRSRARKLMRIHMEREQELSNNKIKFLINISHELRTPLTLIYAPLKRLLESSNIEGEIKSTLVRIFGQSRYMAELINMVLDARRMEAGYGEIDIAEHNFNEWVASIVEEFRDESIEHQTQLSMRLDDQVDTLNFDAPKCRIVLSNLLMNALRYSKRDGSGTIEVASQKIGNHIRLSVIDNGAGLEGVDIDSLFNRFVRINKNSTGSGIGLSYSKAIIEQHRGGVIGAYCNNQRGATFFFELPLGLKCQSEKFESKPYLANMLDIEESSKMTDVDFPLSQHTVLVVDDQEEMITFLEGALSKIFKKVHRASNGIQAFDLIKKHFPDIVVSDVMMPQMDGYELCAKIKNDIEVSHTPIVLLTAKADANSKMLGYKSGADAYISKPFDLQHLLSLLGSQLRSRDISRRYYSQLRSTVNAEEITYSNADEKFMIKLDSFIVDNLSNSIDVEMIAEHMCMSRASLYKKLKTIIDVGAMEHVTKIRMSTAAELLCKTTTPITQIAMQCGYSDNQYFSKAFKQFHGKSPSQFRKENAS